MATESNSILVMVLISGGVEVSLPTGYAFLLAMKQGAACCSHYRREELMEQMLIAKQRELREG